ncbi:MAG: hypothetical protein MUE40_16650 [Anaerolineae bacterium]|nr:hypothetical protein [Anaerolineae bacterium]
MVNAASARARALRRWAGRGLAALLLLLLPLLLTNALLWLFHGATVAQLTPVWSDEIIYWHEALTFARAGFDGGYYAVHEVPAPLAQFRFNAWGPFVPAFYGSFAALFGWPPAAVPVVNLLVGGAGLVALLAADGWRWRTLLVAPGLLLLSIPMLIFAPAAMLERTQHGVALLVAAALVAWRRQPTAGRAWGLAALLAAAALLRMTWALLFLPLCWQMFPAHWRGRAAALVVSGGLLLAFLLLNQLTASPYPSVLSNILTLATTDPAAAGGALLASIGESLAYMLRGHPLEVHQRAQVLLAAGWVLAGLAWGGRRGTLTAEKARRLVWCAYALLAIFVLNVLLYDFFDWRDYRVIAPYLVLVLALAWLWRLRGLLALLLLTTLPLLPTAYLTFRAWSADYVQPERRAQVVALAGTWDDVLRYQPGAEPWCNTVLSTLRYFFADTGVLLTLPPGLGITMILDENAQPFPPQSAYLLLDSGFYERHGGRLRLAWLRDVPGGALYRNLARTCGPP